jgi:hypothetical protein
LLLDNVQIKPSALQFEACEASSCPTAPQMTAASQLNFPLLFPVWMMQNDLFSSVAQEEFSLQILSPFRLVFLREREN